MVRGGYDPDGLLRFFQMLERRGGSGGGGLATYFRTHPPTGDRINRVRQEISKNGGYRRSSFDDNLYGDDAYRDDRYYDGRYDRRGRSSTYDARTRRRQDRYDPYDRRYDPYR
jgi:predicted Zn-dependent protease